MGRKINLLIAERVMGLKVHVSSEGVPYILSPNPNELAIEPDYLTWAGMGEVVEKMEEEGWSWSKDLSGSKFRWWPESDTHPTVCSSDHKNLFVATCIAALKACGVSDEEIEKGRAQQD